MDNTTVPELSDDDWQAIADESDRIVPAVIRRAVDKRLANREQRPAALSEAARDVLAERKRQIEVEGWTPEHDDEHADGSMAKAAACYALHTEPVGNVGDYLRFWPWIASWWKPKGRRSNLVRSAALTLAEIERFDRAADWINMQTMEEHRERISAAFGITSGVAKENG